MICCVAREDTLAEVIAAEENPDTDERDDAKLFTPPAALVPTGRYTVVFADLPVTATVDRTSGEIGRLPLGAEVNVLEVSDNNAQQRIRGRIQLPPGWITMQSSDARVLFVVPCEEPIQPLGEPCPRCGAPLVEGAKYCSNCGARIQGNGLIQWNNNRTNEQFLYESQPPPLPVEDAVRETGNGQSGQAIVEAIEDEPAPDATEGFSLKILFWHKGEETWTSFSRKPLGMRWRMRPPIKIDEVLPGSHADEQGVSKGWQIKMIGEEDMSGMSYRTIAKALQAGLDKLPWEKGANADTM